MRELRLIRSTSDQEIESELNLIGSAGFFPNATPRPLLTVCEDWVALKHMADELHVSEVPETSTMSTHLFHLHCTDHSLGIKEQAVNIFAFAYLLNMKTKTSVLLWQQNRFDHVLQEKLFDQSIPVKWRHLASDAGFLVEPVIQIYLEQAGLIQHTHDETVRLSEKDLAQLFLPAATGLRKAE